MDPFGGMTPERLTSADVTSPAYVVNEVALERNLRVIDQVQQRTKAKVLLALKGFAMWSTFPLIRRYLPGVTASSLSEAMLGQQEFGREVHVYAPAYTDGEIDAVLDIADHITFNSMSQWMHFRDTVMRHANAPKCAVRINPEHSEVATALYDPCAPGSRLGVTLPQFLRYADDLRGLSGFHFHTLCELNSDALERTLKVVEEKFGPYLSRLEWINFGGGHHITRDDYDVDRLVRVINDFQSRTGLDVYLEPGEAIALNTGVLVSTVLDIVENNGIHIAMLDTSATAHMPDVLEMPYRPKIYGAADPGQKPHVYRLGGMTCLAGDVIGDYAFDAPLQVGQRLIFGDMAHYSMVKNTTFNGVHLPSIVIHNSESGQTRTVRRFGYDDYKNRLS